MPIILNIDTAVQSASICVARDGLPLGSRSNPSQKDHAAWLHPAILELLNDQSMALSDIQAIAISAGPGSYTGLRVGMAAAKGLCYALKIPLLTINTLQIMAWGARSSHTDLLCPMIDARRMEVFTALYDRQLQEVRPATNLILDENSFSELLDQKTIAFFGNGSHKFQPLAKHPHAFFASFEAGAEEMSFLSHENFIMGKTAELAYSQPLYGKEFYSPTPHSL